MRSSLLALQIHYNGDDGSACVDLCSLNVWNGCHVGPGRTARTFVLLRAWIWRCYCFWTQCEVVISLSRAAQIYYNDCDDGFTLIFVGWMYETGVALVVPEQRVCLCCFVCALNLNEGFIGVRCSMRRSYLQSHIPFRCQHTLSTIMAMTAFCWSPFVERM